MKFLRQFMIILLLSFLGEVLKMFIPLPIPASDDWCFEDESS